MGGGKTHSLIAFGLLAADPALRREIVPKISASNDFGAAKVVIFNGHQNPSNLLWGYVAEQLGRADAMAPRRPASTNGLRFSVTSLCLFYSTSFNAHGRPWVSKLQPIDYERFAVTG